MVSIKESYRWHVKSFFKEYVDSKQKDNVNIKSRFQCYKFIIKKSRIY